MADKKRRRVLEKKMDVIFSCLASINCVPRLRTYQSMRPALASTSSASLRRSMGEDLRRGQV